MMTTPNSRFIEFLHDINPSNTTIQKSQTAHEEIRYAIANDPEFKVQVKSTFLGGSYKRDTAIRPAKKDGKEKRPDIDSYIVVHGESYYKTPREWMDEVYLVLQKNRQSLGLTRITRNRCSIAITTSKTDVDVSVLLEKDFGDLYRIGNKDTGEWYPTNPELHTEWSVAQNKEFKGHFKPLVKLLKWAMRVNPTRFKHPKSFALEVLIGENMEVVSSHYGELFYSFCYNFLGRYGNNRSQKLCPFLEDPAIPGGDILAGVENEEFCAFYDKIRFFTDQSEKALNTSNSEKATKHWRCIFGNRFPTTKKNITSTLKPAYIASPTVFGNLPARPPALPARFA